IIPLLSLISNGFIIIMDIFEYGFEFYHHRQEKYMSKNNKNGSAKTSTSSETIPANSISIDGKMMSRNIENNDEYDNTEKSETLVRIPAEEISNTITKNDDGELLDADGSQNENSIEIQQQESIEEINESLNSNPEVINKEEPDE